MSALSQRYEEQYYPLQTKVVPQTVAHIRSAFKFSISNFYLYKVYRRSAMNCAETAERIEMLFGTRHSAVSCAKTAERINMPFGLWTPIGPRNQALGGCTLAPPGEYR